MTPHLALSIAFDVQLIRLRRQLASAAPTRLTVLPESQPMVPPDSRVRRVTAPDMDYTAMQQVYRRRWRAKNRATREGVAGAATEGGVSSRLRHLSDDLDQLLLGELPEGGREHGQLPGRLQADRRGDVSREEHAGLLIGNLMAAALFGPRGELRDRSGR